MINDTAALFFLGSVMEGELSHPYGGGVSVGLLIVIFSKCAKGDMHKID